MLQICCADIIFVMKKNSGFILFCAFKEALATICNEFCDTLWIEAQNLCGREWGDQMLLMIKVCLIVVQM